MKRSEVTSGNTLMVTAALEGGRVCPSWTVDVSSAVDALVTGTNEHGETVALDLDQGGVVVWVLGGCLRGQVEDWRRCRPEERSAAQLKRDIEDRAYWHARTAEEARALP